MKLYFDGSVGGRSNKWMTLAGFVATDRTWAKFQKQWEAMLRDRYPIAPYLHMMDLMTGNDPFERVVGWTKEKTESFIDDSVSILRQTPTTELCAFACSIDTKAHERLSIEGLRMPKPAVICAEIGLGALLHWYTEKHEIELAHLFYDRNERFIKSIRDRWLRAVPPKNKKLVTNELFWGRIANIQDVSMHDEPGVQAADLLAWSMTRKLRNAPGDKWARLADSLVGKKGQRGWLTAAQLSPINETLLRQQYALKRDH